MLRMTNVDEPAVLASQMVGLRPVLLGCVSGAHDSFGSCSSIT